MIITPGIDYTYNVGQTANNSVYIPQLKEEIRTAIEVFLVDLILKENTLIIRFSDEIPDQSKLLSIINSHQGLDNIEKILEFNIDSVCEDYAMSNFYDTRISIEANYYFRRPTNFKRALDCIKQYIPVFLQEVRPTTNDLSAIITEMSKSKNNLELLALWSLYRRKRDGIVN